ncbi:hypothetical protein GF362_04225 [Candidatus Dojkabacteria bacterium]|nr:hypothetical protein [Candidatus Dojkabacteria bacterium]
MEQERFRDHMPFLLISALALGGLTACGNETNVVPDPTESPIPDPDPTATALPALTATPEDIFTDDDGDYVNDSDEAFLGMTPGVHDEMIDLPEGRFQFHLRINGDQFVYFDGDNYDPYIQINPETLSSILSDLENPDFGDKITPQFDFSSQIWNQYLGANPELQNTGIPNAFNFRPEDYNERVIYMNQDFFHDLFPLQFLYDDKSYDPVEGLRIRQTLDSLGVVDDDYSNYSYEQLVEAGTTAIFSEEIFECTSGDYPSFTSQEDADAHSLDFKRRVFRDVLEGRIEPLFDTTTIEMFDPAYIRTQIESWPWFRDDMIQQTEQYFDEEFPEWRN